jgi:hypothetical protein
MSRKSSSVSKNCNDNLRNVLLNAVNVATKGVVLPNVYCKSRINLYKKNFAVFKNTKNATIKPKNLYVILYSRYYTLRQIMYNRELEIQECEDDVGIKEQFKQIMSGAVTSKQLHDNEFFKIIEGLKTPKVYKLYRDLDSHIMKGPLCAEDVTEFVTATSETDIFIAKELS